MRQGKSVPRIVLTSRSLFPKATDMKHFCLALSFAFGLMFAGCESASTTNVGENADAKAMQDYEAEIAAQEKASNEAEQAAGN